MTKYTKVPQKCPQSTPNYHHEVSQSTLSTPEYPRITAKYPKVSEHVRKYRKVSESIGKYPKVSESIRKFGHEGYGNLLSGKTPPT